MTELQLTQTDKEGLKQGIKSDGRKYSVRDNRDRFMYPNEWNDFYNVLVEKRQRITFNILMGTGCRINEARNIKVGDVDLERCNIILRITKIKAKKGEKNPRPRTVSISSALTKKIRKYISINKLKNEDYLGLLSAPGAHTAFKTNLEKAKVNNPHQLSLHNIRKTHGNYLKAIGVEGAEICTRLGHDYNTFLTSYSSPNIFNQQDIIEIRRILGDVYMR